MLKDDLDDNHGNNDLDDESSLMTNYQMTIPLNDDNDPDADNSILIIIILVLHCTHSMQEI